MPEPKEDRTLNTETLAFQQDRIDISKLYLELSEVKNYDILANLLARLEFVINEIKHDVSKRDYNKVNLIYNRAKMVNFAYSSMLNNYNEFVKVFTLINRGEDIDDVVDDGWIDNKDKLHTLYPLVNGLGKMKIKSGALEQTINIVNGQPIFSGDNVIVPVFIDTEYLVEGTVIRILLNDIYDDDVWDSNDLSIGVGTYEDFVNGDLIYQVYNEQGYEEINEKYYLAFDLLDLYKTSYGMPWVVSVWSSNYDAMVNYIVYFNIQDSPEPPEPEPIPVDPEEGEEEEEEEKGETGPK